MKKHFTNLRMALVGFLVCLMSLSMMAQTPAVILDFTTNDWGFPTSKVIAQNSYTNTDGYTITLEGTTGNGYRWYSNYNYLLNGKEGATLTLPAFDFAVEKIVVEGREGASTNVTQNIFVGTQAVSTQTTSAAVTQEYIIDANYRAAGTIYTLKVTNAYNTQMTAIKIYAATTPEPPTPIVVSVPTFAPEAGTYTAAQNVTITCATEGAAIYYTLDGSAPTASSTLYENAIEITETTTINAIAILDETISDMATATYTIEVTPVEPDEPTVLELDSIATLPYAYNFEDVDPYFMINNGEATNKWYIGQAQTFDNKKLYISSNNGTTNKYDITAASTVTAYRDVMIPATGAILTFDYRVNGQTNTTDYLKVDLNGNEIARLVGENDWASFSYDISGEMAGEVRVQFTWVNNASAGNQFPAAIDNLSVIETPCSQPTNLAAAMDSTTAVITWEAIEGQTAWNFQYKLADHSEWYTVPVTATTVTLNDLQGNSNYVMRVQAVCGENVSAWTNGTFAVACQTETVVTTQDDVLIGNGTSTNSYLPFYGTYNYTYSQQIIDAAEINATNGSVYSVSFNCSSAPASTSTGNIKIWMANTTKSVFDSNTDYIDPANLTLVYEGPSSYAYQTGWNTFTFDTPFEYTGDNLVVAYYEGNGSWNGGSFYVHSTTTNKSIMHYNDTQSAVSYTSPASATGTKYFNMYRNNMKLNMDVTVVTCDDQIACVAPTGLEVSDITPNSAVLTWTAGAEGQTNFIVEYQAEGATEWTPVEVTDTTYTLTELAQLTNYSVKVKANCGTNNWSEVITTSFRTLGICPPVTNLETSNVSNTTTLTWEPGGEESAWLVQFKPASEGDDAWTSIDVSLIPMTTFGGLQGNVDYDVRVKALCDPENEENQSEWANTTFHSGCAAFDLPFAEEFPTNTMPDCWENEDFHFASSGYAYSYTNGAELITPAINIPAENPTYLTFEVRGAGDYTVLASYRGTRADRFAEIYTGTAPNQNTVVTIEIDNLYKGRAVNFKIVNNSTNYQYFYNVIVNQCPFEATALTVADYTGTTIDLTWEADEAATNFQVQYGEQGFTLGEGTVVTVTDTTAVTVNELNYETAYDFYVRVVCAGDNGAWVGPVSGTTAPACSDPVISTYEFSEGSLVLTLTPGEWGTPTQYNVRYKLSSAAEYTYETVTTTSVTISGLESNTAYELGVQSICGENMESNWVSMDLTTPCLALAIPYTQDFEGDVFPPECWSQEYVTGNIDWEVENGAAMFSDEDGSETRLLTPPFDLSAALRDAVLSFTHKQAVWVSDQDELRVYYRTSSNGSWNLLAEYTEDIPNMTPVEITLPAAALTSYCQFAFVGQGNYGYGVYVDDFGIDWAPSCGAPTLAVEIPTATITPNVYGTPTAYEIMIGDASQIVTTTTVNLSSYLTIGEEYDVKVRSICGEGDTSAWSNTVHFLYMVSHNIDDQTSLTTCGVMLYDNGGADEYYESSSDNTVTIYPETSTSVIHLTGEYNTESGWDKIYIYDGTSTSATQIGEYSGTGTLDILATNAAGALTIRFTSDGSVNYSGFAFLLSCYERPSCGTPTVAVSITEATITPNPMATSTPTAYELRIGDATQTVTTTTVNLDDYFTLVVGDEYELFVRAICGDNEASDWTSVTFVKPIACSGTVEAYEITGTSATTSYLPSYSYYNYSLTQQMYLASEIEVPQGGIIYSLSLNVTTAKSRNVDIYVGTTTASNLSSWVPAANFQLVYSGTAFDHTGTNEFTFTNPIIYNGTDNLVVMVDDNTGSYVSGLAAASHSGATNRAKYVYSDGTNYSVTSVTTYSGTTTSTRNNIVFNICANPEPTCPAPKNITLGTVTETTAQVSWTAGGSETEWEVSYTVGDQTTTETTTDNPYTITGLTASTLYDIPFSVKAICSTTDESTVNNTTLSFNTVCAPVALPYSENFDSYTSTTTQSTMVMPICWNRKYTGTSTTYGAGIYNSSSYAVSGTNSLRFYNTCSTSTSTTYGDIYAVLPQMDAAINELMISFDAKTSTTTSYNSFFEVGVITDVEATDYSSVFQPIGTAHIVPAGGQSFNILLSDYTGANGNIAFRVTKARASGESRTGSYTYVYMDNIKVERIPTCFVPTALTVSEVTDHSAQISWTDNYNQTNFAVEYRADNESGWTTVNVDTTYCLLNNLNDATEYFVRVKAVCGTNDESEYTEEVAFSTFCQSGTSYTNVGTGTSSTSAYYPVYNGSNYSYSQQIFTAEEINVTAGQISSLSIEYNYATAMTAKNDVKIYLANTDKEVFANTSDWVTDGMQLVYEGALNCQQGWNEFAFTTPFTYDGHNLVVVMEDLSGNYNSSSYNFKTTNTGSGIYRTMYYYNSSNPFSGGTANSRAVYRTNMRFDVCPVAVDITVIGIENIPDACDVEGGVSITVKNMGYEPITTFDASYQLNEETPVQEAVTLDAPLAFGETTVYTFNTLPNIVSGTNFITASVVLEGDAVETNNSLTSDPIVVLDPATVPYEADFNGLTINHGWNPIDANNDGITMNLNNDINYTFNDEAAANDWMMSPCIEMAAGTYTIIYDYKANSSLTEAFEVYYGNGNHVADMTNAVATHSFNNTDYETATTTITIAADGIYNFGFHATSLAGNLGFSIDNFKVYPVNDVIVTCAANGTVTPNGTIAVNYGEDLTLNLVPDPMYHVAGVWVDDVQVVPEDGTGANFMLYTLENVTEPHTVFVDFKLEFHIFKTVENFRADLYSDLGGAFVPAATDTTIDPNAFTVNMVADPHYHLAGLTVSPMVPDMPEDVFAGVVDNGDGTYSYTIDTLVVANYYVNAIFRRDTVAINYTVLTGKGYANDSQLLNTGDTYTTWVDYSVNNDVDTTVTFAGEAPYYVADVIVNGTSMGHVDSYTFENVTETQTVGIKYGYKIDASVSNYNTYGDIAMTDPQGTIEPATQYIPEYDPMTVTGTVAEHFHLYQLLVNGENRIDEVVFGADNHSYSFSMDSVDNNYTIVAVVKVDTFAITYNVLAGQGYADASELLVAGDTYSTIVNYGDNWYSNIVPATGYSIENVLLDGQNMYTASNNQFNFIVESHVFDITFEANTYTITTNAYGAGTVTDGMTFTYDPQNPVDYVFNATPAEGYYVSAVIINNEAQDLTGVEGTYTTTIENVADNYVINAHFSIFTYTMTAEAGEGGTITPAGAQTVNYGTDVTYEINANEGWYIASTDIDGVTTTYTQDDAVVTLTIPYTAINADHNISVTFAQFMYTITATAGANGTVNDAAAVSANVAYGSNYALTFTPAANYQVADVVVDGVTVGAVNSYEFINVTANHTVEVSFEAIMYTLTATSNMEGCTITPATTTVQAGSNVSYTLSAASGCHLLNVIANGEEVAVTNNAFTITDVQSDYTIFANFAPNYVTVTVNQPAHATITPGTQTYAYGATPSYMIVPEVGYEVVSVTAGNAVVNVTYNNGIGTFTLAALQQDITLTATTSIKKFEITVTQGANGTIAPGTQTNVEYGSNKTFTITPNQYYVIADVIVDGSSRGAISSYTFYNVAGNHTITAVFEANCQTPTNLTAMDIDTTSAVLSWVGTAPSYEVRYKAADAASYTTQTVTTTSLQLTGLTPNTLYEYGVRAICGANLTSDWAINAFTTKALPIGPVDGIANAELSSIKVYSYLNNVYIVNEEGIAISNVDIYDIYGKQVYTGKVLSSPEVISLSVANGNYVVRLATENGVGVYKVAIVR